VVVIGAGIGGLCAALRLAARGIEVTVLERAATPGGKARHVHVAGQPIDGGPTVFTMRWVFEELLAEAGCELATELDLRPLELLARHAWDGGGTLDLFTDTGRSMAAIESLSGADEARRFGEFCTRSRKVYESLERTFMAAPLPSMPALVLRAGLRGLPGLLATSPFMSMWKALGQHFKDPRLQQLFGRYATYCGSSPWLAPSTLMLVAHAEKLGVWSVAGGMHGLASSLARLATARGANFRYASDVTRIELSGGRTSGVVLANGERLPADIVVSNADVAALADGRFGADVRHAVKAQQPARRSLSAVTWCLAAQAHGFPLARHTVFFSDRYQSEFDDIFVQQRLPATPTVYVCAQDRDDSGTAPAGGCERLLVLANAPAIGDQRELGSDELAAYEARSFGMLERCGLRIERAAADTVVTTPAGFERLFPASGGALYGPASHGWRSSFVRPRSRSRVPGLYLAGGSVHPGPGVPMVALSGRLAADAVLADLGAI
jgi:1-hydroxycarotenoid 3,4-desaturase